VSDDAETGLAALKGFILIAERWALTTSEQMTLLGSPSDTTFFSWKRDQAVALPPETIERIGLVLGIWKALRLLIPDDRQAIAWVKRPSDHPVFGGQPPLVRMLQGRNSDLAEVRNVLAARMSVW
jgi:hypothetical protein